MVSSDKTTSGLITSGGLGIPQTVDGAALTVASSADTFQGLKAGLITAISDLQSATADAFKGYDEQSAKYYEDMRDLVQVQSDRIIELECVVDSLVKLFALGEKMAPEALAQHQDVLVQFLKRDLPTNASGNPDCPPGSIGG